MKLLYTLTAYPPSTGGAQLHQHMLAQKLSKNNSLQVVTHWDENRTDWLLGTTLHAPQTDLDYVIDGINVHRVGLMYQEKVKILPYVLTYYPMMQRALPPIADCFVQHLKPYAVQTDLIHNVRIGREGLSYASLQVARQYDIPFVFTPLHHPRWVGWRYQAYIQLYQMADRLIALTNNEKRLLIEFGVREDRITVTGIGPILAEEAHPAAFLAKYAVDGPAILFLGQHYPYKGYQAVLQSALLVWKRIPEAHFVFIGPAVGNSEKVFAAHVDQRIHRLGKVDLQEKTDALAACSLLCVPSTQESFGGVYTEAWSFGKPTIGCNIPAVSEVISDGVDGYLVEQEPAQIAERIMHLLLNSGVARVMGEKGQQKTVARYTWLRLAELTEQAYRQTMNGLIG